jgi:hypothetical protein
MSGLNAQMIGTGRSHDLVVKANNLIEEYLYNVICALVDFILERCRSRLNK